jgi:hypothetical protein
VPSKQPMTSRHLLNAVVPAAKLVAAARFSLP